MRGSEFIVQASDSFILRDLKLSEDWKTKKKIRPLMSITFLLYGSFFAPP